MDKTSGALTVQVGPQGRVVIPAEVRRELGIETGDRLVVRVEGGEVVMARPLEALQEFLRQHPKLREGPSMADELIRERRAEAAREHEDMG